MKKTLLLVLFFGLAVFVFGCGEAVLNEESTTIPVATTTTAAGATTTTAAGGTTTTITSTTSTTTSTTVPKAPSPAFVPPSGSIEANSILVTIEAPGADAVYYTLDGTTPTAASILYTAPISLEASNVVKAIAVKSGYLNSDVTTGGYDLYWWQALGNGVSASLYAMAIGASGKIFVGGATAPSDGYIFRWTGVTWETLGAGLNAAVECMFLDPSTNDLYVGGNFTQAGGNPATGVARWDGSAWHAVSAGTTSGGNVSALTMDDSGNLYAGGHFTMIDGVSANFLAKCANPSTTPSWSAFTDQPDSPVFTLGFNSGSLYAGGNFGHVGTLAASEIARCTNLVAAPSWEAFGSGLDNSPYSMTFDSVGNLYIGGLFTTAGGVTVNHIARRNIALGTWEALANGINTTESIYVYGLAYDQNDVLYAGGSFTTFDSTTYDRIARWNGFGWLPVGDGTNDHIYALARDALGNIYACGIFTTAGGITVNTVAKWGKKL